MKQLITSPIEYLKNMDTLDVGTLCYGTLINVGIWSNLISTYFS